MRIKPRLILVLTLWLACTIEVYAQESDKNRTDEEDARVSSVVARQNAVTTLMVAGDQFRDAGDEVKAASAWNRAGRFQLKLNQAEQAITTYNRALKGLDEKSDPQTFIDSLNGLASGYKGLSECVQAREVIRRTISLSEKHGYVEGLAEALLIQPDCVSDKALALKSAEESLRLWKSVNNKLGIARAFFVVGEYQMIQNNLSGSSESYETAMRLWEELNVPPQVAEALISLGFIEYRKGAWQASLSFYIRAQQLIDAEAEPYMMGQILAGIAEAFLESGMPETGLIKYRESLNHFLLTKKPSNRIGIEWGIGRAHYLCGNYTEAIAMLTATRAEAETLEDFMVVALSDDFLGRTYFAMNDYAEALKHYQSAAEVFKKSNNPMEAARILALMGQVYQAQGDPKNARTLYQRALTSFRKLADQLNESATLYALGTLDLQLNLVDTAEKYLLESIKITEQMRRVSTSVDLTAAFSARIHERYEKYIDCLMRKHRSSGSKDLAVEAFRMSELARARALTELLHATGGNPFSDVDPQLAQRERSLREFLQANENAKVDLLSRTYTTSELEALEKQHAQLKAEHERVVSAITAHNPNYEQIMRPTAWDLKKIQQQVVADDETTLLEFSIGSEKSYLWAITRDQIVGYELPAGKQIEKTAERVYKLLATVPGPNTDNELASAIQELSDMVLSPARSELANRRIIVVADGILNYIPFQVLIAPGTNEALVASKEIVNAPSASILGELQLEASHRKPASRVLAAFGDPVFAPANSRTQEANGSSEAVATGDLRSSQRGIDVGGDVFDPKSVTRLFYAKRELNDLGKVAGANSLIASEEAATREEFLKTDLTQFSILHLVTHGFFNPGHPEKSGFVLSTVDRNKKEVPGFVGLREIYELRAPVLLVVLSACQTALGKDMRGEGLVGLTRSFMYAGASGVVASLWKVDDAATSALMKSFYTNMLQHGMKPGEALRAAQNSIRQQPEWRSPYYWAAFTLQGESRQIIQAQSQSTSLPSTLVAGFVLISGIGAVGGWYLRRRISSKAR